MTAAYGDLWQFMVVFGDRDGRWRLMILVVVVVDDKSG